MRLSYVMTRHRFPSGQALVIFHRRCPLKPSKVYNCFRFPYVMLGFWYWCYDMTTSVLVDFEALAEAMESLRYLHPLQSYNYFRLSSAYRICC